MDGGTRLNAPIKPALDLGADRIITIGFEPLAAAPAPPLRARRPRLTDVAVNVLDGLITDQVGADMHRLAAINSFFAGGPGDSASSSGLAYRESRGRRPYRRIRYALVAPSERGELGRLAEEAYLERYGGLRALRDPDAIVLGRLLRAGGGGRGELLSYLLFDQAFVQRLVEAGAATPGAGSTATRTSGVPTARTTSTSTRPGRSEPPSSPGSTSGGPCAGSDPTSRHASPRGEAVSGR